MALPPGSLTVRWATTLVALALLAAPAAGERVRQLTAFNVAHLESHAVDDAGSVAFFVSSVDPLGTNPGVVMQVFEKTLPGGSAVQVTTLDAHVYGVTVSDDGETILFRSGADPLGTNPDGGPELFLADADGGSMVQLTVHPGGTGVHEAVLSGDAGTALFVSDGDLTGQNPSLVPQLFTMDTDGTNLRQLTAATGPGSTAHLAISDDGQRIAFVDDRDLTGDNADGSVELFAVAGDGTGLTQITAGSHSFFSVAIAGVGTPIVYTADEELRYADWGSPQQKPLVEGAWNATVTDAGDRIYYNTFSNRADIYRIDLVESTAGADATRKPGDPPLPIEIWVSSDNAGKPVVSGDGSLLLFTLLGETAPFVTNLDALQLLATDGDGLVPEQVVDAGEDGRVVHMEMTADGSRVVFPWGDWTWWDRLDLFLADTESGEVAQVTERAETINPSISDDGNAIVFFSYKPLLPELCDIGGIYRIGADGSGLQQLVPDPVTCESYPDPSAAYPSISNDGTKVVYRKYLPPDVYGVNAAGGPVWQVTDDGDGWYKVPRIDGTGTWAVYMSGSDVTGQNPDQGTEIFRIHMDGSGVEQISADPAYVSMHPDISASGQRIVYHSWADPLGTNPDHNAEIFLYDASTESTEQLTATADGDNLYPRISPNGEFVVFHSTSPWVSSSPMTEVYRLEPSTGEVRLVSAGMAWLGEDFDHKPAFDVDDDGNVAFCGDADLVGSNPDLSIELWLAEFNDAPRFRFTGGNPTRMQWDPSPGSLGYDVIRGDLTALGPGVDGTVNLGAVVCVEDDSSDAMTAADESAELAPGQGFFYLYRGDPGDLIGPGSWGQGTGGAERLPAGGECPAGH